MQVPDDAALLSAYVTQQSEEAFATLVERHVSLVYSSALRQARDPHLAEEITQVVFTTLARKAATLGKATVLAGWLCRTAHFVACNTLKAERRRQHREREAHMNSVLNDPEPDVWPQVSPWLDEAVAQLSEADRNAVVLRFYEQRPLEDVGRVLGLSADAAQKRVSRALEKLRRFFLKRSVVSSGALIAAAISANSVQSAPLGLAQSATAVALAPGAMVGGSTLTLVPTTLIAMKIKTIVAALIAALLVGLGGYLFYPSKPARGSAVARETLPIKFANDAFTSGPSDDQFLTEIDPTTRRTTNSAPAIHIRCNIPPTSTGSADFVKSLTNIVARGLASSRYARYRVPGDSVLCGKRIRVTGWMKTSEVGNWAGATLMVVKASGDVVGADPMYDRPLHGTTDWQQIEFVTDVPQEACLVAVVPTLYGTGEMWADEFQIDIVPSNTPTTDLGRWTVWSQCPADYSETVDADVTHNGHPALCITYVSSERPQKYSFVWWGKHNRDLETFRPYLGHTVRMTVWAKSEDLSDRAGLDFQPKARNDTRLAKSRSAKAIRGTTDWKEYSIICDIPEETLDFQTGVFMYGSGKLWVDTNSFRWEIIK